MNSSAKFNRTLNGMQITIEKARKRNSLTGRPLKKSVCFQSIVWKWLFFELNQRSKDYATEAWISNALCLQNVLWSENCICD